MADPAGLLKRVRAEAGLTQANLARRIGTTQTAVARLERSGANPRIETLERAVRATGHRLELRATPALAELDEAQIATHLRMTPAERADAHDAAYRNVARSARAAWHVE